MLIIEEIKKSFLDERRQRRSNNMIAMQLALASAPETKRLLAEKNGLWVQCVKGQISEKECLKRASRIEGKIDGALASSGFATGLFSYKPLCGKCTDTGYANHKMCSCLSQYIIAQLNLSNTKMNTENFSTFDPTIFSDEPNEKGESCRSAMEANRQRMLEYCRSFRTQRENFLFIGPVGSGKTFMSNSVAYDLASYGRSVICVTANRLVTAFDDRQHGKGSIEETDIINNCELLVIDDLGSEQISDYTGNLIFNVVNDRLIEMKDMIISTNLVLRELNERYSQRLVSRLTGNFHGVKFPSRDMRARIRKQNQALPTQ
ncbi:MAG: ATP-binding protein [Eubacteriaceae bacterium]|jgi:DNA replication protein DnaC|nr:ATP-binding protein [Eubacteriaceae bacterium]